MKEIRSINQSMMRGGEKFTVFYSYNPPQNRRSWVNREALKSVTICLCIRVRILMYRKLVGRTIFLEAKYLKKLHINQYNHEYLGEVTGTGGEIFDNLEVVKLSDEEVKVLTILNAVSISVSRQIRLCMWCVLSQQ